MSNNYGKKFEAKLKEDFLKIPDSKILRLYDVTMGYAKVCNPCDFIYYKYPYMFMLECKSTEANTFNFNKLRQYEDLCDAMGIKGLNPGIVI